MSIDARSFNQLLNTDNIQVTLQVTFENNTIKVSIVIWQLCICIITIYLKGFSLNLIFRQIFHNCNKIYYLFYKWEWLSNFQVRSGLCGLTCDDDNNECLFLMQPVQYVPGQKVLPLNPMVPTVSFSGFILKVCICNFVNQIMYIVHFVCVNKLLYYVSVEINICK